MIRVGVKILPRTEVLDSQGRAVRKVLSQNRMECEDVRVGKFVVLQFASTSKTEAIKQAKEMSEKVLHNPLIETFELEVL